MPTRILVLGGTGVLGRPVALALHEAGFDVRVMVRKLESAQNVLDAAMELVQGDITDLESLERAMSGCHGVHISIGGAVDQLSAEHVCKLATRLGVERITYISGATVCEENRWFPMVAQKLNAEKAIRESGVDYTIFCPTWAMEMLARFVRDGQPVMMGNQPTPLHWFAADDLGRMVVAAYRTEAAANKRFIVHGPQAIPMREALERYCAVFHPGGKPVSAMPIWLAKTISTLTRNEELRFAAGLMGYFDKIGELGDPAEANVILGAPTITLDDWMQQRQSHVLEGASRYRHQPA